jgi:hypothetical protein
MAGCLFLCYWPDFTGGSPNASFSPSLVAARLRRQLALRYDSASAYAWTSGDRETAEVFRRWGLRLLSSDLGPDTFVSLRSAHAEAEHLVLAMSQSRAEDLLSVLALPAWQVEIWTPDEDGDAQTLTRALQLSTAQPVGIFIDWHSVEAHGGVSDPALVARECVQHAELAGTVVTAQVFGASGSSGGTDYAGTGARTQSADLRSPTLQAMQRAGTLRAELERLLEDPRAPRTWILVTHANWISELTAQAQARGIRVLLWPPSEVEVPLAARVSADGCSSLIGLLPSLFEHLAPVPRLTPERREPELVREELPAEPGQPSARLSPWTRLIYHTECLLRQSRVSRISSRKLAGVLAELEEFGPTPTNAMLWTNRARSEGMLLSEPEWHRGEPAARINACRPNPEHPLVRAATEVPDRCLRLLHQMLQKIPWVSFKLLRNVLARDQWLGGSPFYLDGVGIDEWLNFLIHDGAIRMTKEPNLVNPDFPVTALRLNPEHPLSRLVVVEATEGTRLAAERAILAVDHFMTRNRKPWMAMGALRRSLEAMGREELQSVLQGLQNLGALVTESYPNPQKEHSTTGCRLKSDEPIVTEALHVRNTIIRVTQEHQRMRNWVPLAQVNEELNVHCGAAPSSLHRLAWFLLLRDEGILELDHDGHLPGSAWESVRCRLNLTDAVVRSIVSDRLLSEAVTEADGVPAEWSESHVEIHLAELERPTQIAPGF